MRAAEQISSETQLVCDSDFARQLERVKDELMEALEDIIEMNRQTAADKYGDPERAEAWSCVTVARKALASAKALNAN